LCGKEIELRGGSKERGNKGRTRWAVRRKYWQASIWDELQVGNFRVLREEQLQRGQSPFGVPCNELVHKLLNFQFHRLGLFACEGLLRRLVSGSSGFPKCQRAKKAGRLRESPGWHYCAFISIPGWGGDFDRSFWATEQFCGSRCLTAKHGGSMVWRGVSDWKKRKCIVVAVKGSDSFGLHGVVQENNSSDPVSPFGFTVFLLRLASLRFSMGVT